MKIIQRNIDELISAEYNPRQMTQHQHNSLTDSIREFGLVDPILVNIHADRKNIIIGGHQRVTIAKELGISQAAVNFRKKAADWDLILLLLDRYKKVTQKQYKK